MVSMNEDHRGVLPQTAERKSGRKRWDNKGRIRRKLRGKYLKSVSENEEVWTRNRRGQKQNTALWQIQGNKGDF